MKRPGFAHGVMAALVLALAASIVGEGLAPFLGSGFALRLVIPFLALAYVLWLFSRCGERTGRITVFVAWCLMSLAAWWLAPSLPVYVLLQAAAIWLVRSLYFYSGVIPSLLDMALTAFAVLASAWALSRSGSLFLATWCFFLPQALFVAIPPALDRGAARLAGPEESFERARRRADAALKQLITR